MGWGTCIIAYKVQHPALFQVYVGGYHLKLIFITGAILRNE